jgi:hypothetical protein
VGDRISELKDKIEVKGKMEEVLVKQLNSCERNMQEFSDYIKRPYLRIMGIEEGGEGQAKEIHNMLNKILMKISQIVRKICPFRYRKLPGHQTVLTKIVLTHSILSVKQQAKRTEKEY